MAKKNQSHKRTRISKHKQINPFLHSRTGGASAACRAVKDANKLRRSRRRRGRENDVYWHWCCCADRRRPSQTASAGIEKDDRNWFKLVSPNSLNLIRFILFSINAFIPFIHFFHSFKQSVSQWFGSRWFCWLDAFFLSFFSVCYSIADCFLILSIQDCFVFFFFLVPFFNRLCFFFLLLLISLMLQNDRKSCSTI